MNPWANNPWQAPPPAWYQPNTHPHVYVPPPQASYPHPGFWEQPPPPSWTTPNYNELRSSLYPTLNPVLAIDSSPMRYNLRKKPRTEIFTSQYYAYLQFAATTTYATHMRLICRSFPWSIDIKTTPYITCEKVWEALHLALHEELEDSEWGLIVTDEDSRRRVLKAARKRWDGAKESSGPHVLKRIDFLGDRTVFVGLEKNEEFETERQLPGSSTSSAETWVVKLGSS